MILLPRSGSVEAEAAATKHEPSCVLGICESVEREALNTSPAGMRFCHEDLVVEQQEWCDILTGFRFG